MPADPPIVYSHLPVVQSYFSRTNSEMLPPGLINKVISSDRKIATSCDGDIQPMHLRQRYSNWKLLIFRQRQKAKDLQLTFNNQLFLNISITVLKYSINFLLTKHMKFSL